jgi:DNA-binding HxlR family transcriptional regulator
MRTYEQYCPIARAAEIFAERWTPLIVRNIHAGFSTYGEILAGLPGMSHTMLTQRLRHLVRVGVVTTAPKESGSGVRYVLTDAGNELWPVLLRLGAWGERSDVTCTNPSGDA